MTALAQLAPCGTYGAAQRHKRHGEPLDDACKSAERSYQRAYRAANPDARERDLWWNRTRQAALERLAREYPQRLAELVKEERAAGPTPYDAAS